MKAALVNIETEIVENIIIVDSLESPVPSGFILIDIPISEEVIEYTDEEKQLYDILEEIDPDFIRPETSSFVITETPIMIGQTKWNINDGFYE
jgi:hypothetical protein